MCNFDGIGGFERRYSNACDVQRKFSRESINLNTTTNEAFEPEAEEYVFSAIANDVEGDAKGQTVAKYVGDEEASITALKEMVFPAAGE